jgi:predicted TIM-barrel fold metal-dependent hydrolase
LITGSRSIIDQAQNYSGDFEGVTFSKPVLVLSLVAAAAGIASVVQQNTPEHLLLKDYKPQSIYHVPKTNIVKAKYPVVDMHSHAYAKTPEQVRSWIKTMNDVGIEKTVVLSMAYGAEFEKIKGLYSKYPDRFELWCGIDFSAYGTPQFPASAVRGLQDCADKGGKGIGELHDKGEGLAYGKQFAHGLHPDDARLDPIFEKAADLKLPINIHISEPQWMYEPMDAHNDGLMNAYEWRRDNKGNLPGHEELTRMFERAVQKHPRTTFIACHFANQEANLDELGRLLDKYPNLYADIAARYAETAPIPRYMLQFYQRYQDRLLYGTDMGFEAQMYRGTFRILESRDEHFYDTQYGYHWPLYGFGLPDAVLKRLYRDNALKIMKSRG